MMTGEAVAMSFADRVDHKTKFAETVDVATPAWGPNVKDRAAGSCRLLQSFQRPSCAAANPHGMSIIQFNG